MHVIYFRQVVNFHLSSIMLTPSFSVTQDKNAITIKIRAPHAKVQDTDIYINGCEFRFFCKPYFLRLHFSGNLVEDGQECAKYDFDTGFFTVVVSKEISGEEFVGLDMISKLLAPPEEKHCVRPVIEELSESSNTSEAAEQLEDSIDWYFEQDPVRDAIPECVTGTCSYGFANKKSGIITKIQDEFIGVFDIKNPDSVDGDKRTCSRVQQEQEKFSDDHYLFDLFENDEVKELLEYKPWWENLADSKDIVLTEMEHQQILKLPFRKQLLDTRETQIVSIGLVDIVFSYAYNTRITMGEENIESAWNVSKLSSTLSWFETFNNLHSVLIASFRRSVCFPLIRHFQLSATVLQDTRQIFALGRMSLLKCLLEVHQCMNKGDMHYILNDLYVTDYCLWLQSCSDKIISSLAEALSKELVDKNELGFDLMELEQAAHSCIEEEHCKNVEEVVRKAGELHINQAEEDSDDITDSESDSDTDSESCSDSQTENTEIVESDVKCK